MRLKLAEGTDPLFTNWRTGEQLNLATGIAISSTTSLASALAGPLPLAIVSATTASLASALAPALPAMIVSAGTVSLASALAPGLPLALVSAATASLSNVLLSAILFNNISLTGNSTAFAIPEWVKRISFWVFTASSNAADDYPLIQISFDGSTYITSNYFVTGYNVAAPANANGANGIVSMLTSLSAGSSFTFFGDIYGFDSGALKSSKFSGGATSATFSGGAGYYIANTGRIASIRAILATATASFDAGGMTIVGHP